MGISNHARHGETINSTLGAIFGRKLKKSFHGYTPATRYAPEFIVPFLVFQGGVPKTKFASLVGGGQMPSHEYRAMSANNGNVLISNAPGYYSITGGGQIPFNPAFLQPLSGGTAGVGS
jgi:hypothetical protein